MSGKIRIVAGLTGAAFFLPEHLKRFQGLYPDVEVRAEVAGATESLRLIRDQDVDFGVGPEEIPPEDVEFHQVLSTGRRLIVPL